MIEQEVFQYWMGVTFIYFSGERQLDAIQSMLWEAGI